MHEGNDKHSIKHLHDVEFEALQRLKQLCSAEDIHFFLRGGTALGAVKYEGFIPWDDDLDIAVPRKDYEKFIALFADTVIDEKFKILHYTKNIQLPCYFPRMYLTEKYRISMGFKANTNQGLHIMDIFPLDGAPNHWVTRQAYFFLVYSLRFLAGLSTDYSNIYDIHTEKQKKIINFFKKLKVQKIVPQKKIYKILDCLYKSQPFDQKKYAGTITGSLMKKEIFPKDVWGKGKLLTFEKDSFNVPSQEEIYVCQLYGKNCLKEEPSVTERKSHISGMVSQEEQD